MKCPVDGETLTMADRAGVEIDYCPKCRGVWLDRGELDKILERAGRHDDDDRRAVSRPEPARERRDYDTSRDRKDYDSGDRRPYKKRESWWSDIFDF